MTPCANNNQQQHGYQQLALTEHTRIGLFALQVHLACQPRTVQSPGYQHIQ